MEGVSAISNSTKPTTTPKRARTSKTVDDLEPIAVTVTEAMRLMGLRDNKSIYAMIRRGASRRGRSDACSSFRTPR